LVGIEVQKAVEYNMEWSWGSVIKIMWGPAFSDQKSGLAWELVYSFAKCVIRIQENGIMPVDSVQGESMNEEF